MGELSVDTDALRAVAAGFDDAATVVEDVVRVHISQLRFDGADGGRDYVASADSVHDALARVVAGLGDWSRACREIAATLRDGAAGYAEAEAVSTGRLG